MFAVHSFIIKCERYQKHLKEILDPIGYIVQKHHSLERVMTPEEFEGKRRRQRTKWPD